MNKGNFFSAKNVAILGVLVALVIVLQLYASAIPMLGVSINLSLIPIAFAGIMLGALGGAIVGFTCGIVVFITMAVLGQEPSTAALFQASPVILTIMCVGKTTLAGVACGLIYKFFPKRNFFLAVMISVLAIPVVNTGTYMLGIVIMKDAAAEFLGLTSSSAGLVFALVFAMIWINFVVELAVNFIFAPIIYRVTKILEK